MAAQFKCARVLSYVLCFLLSFCPLSALATTAQLTAMRVTTGPSKTHIVLEFNTVVTYKILALQNPTRLVIELPQTQLEGALPTQFDHTVLRGVRSSYPQPDTLRVVLDLTDSAQFRSGLVKGRSGKNYVTVDLTLQITATPLITNNKDNVASADDANADTDIDADSDSDSDTDIQTPSVPADDDVQLQQSLLAAELAQPVVNSKLSPARPPAAPTSPPLILATPADLSLSTPLPAPAAVATKQRIINVVIDPGHGGKDPGTEGVLGMREKELVLGIGLNLNQLLQKDPRFHAVMTRHGDYFLSLRQRLSVARSAHADVFISIHADTFNDPLATGVSIYALSAHGASSEAALWLAKQENYAELGGIKLNDKSTLLRSVLIDLSQSATISSGLQLGQDLLHELAKLDKLHHNNIEQAPFMVLKSPDIPSVLIETGFLSNPSEAERLRNPLYQQRLAGAIYAGLLDYFATNPAAGKQLVATKKV